MVINGLSDDSGLGVVLLGLGVSFLFVVLLVWVGTVVFGGCRWLVFYGFVVEHLC